MAAKRQSDLLLPFDFAAALAAAGLIEQTERITEIKIIARPDEAVTIEVTYLADQRLLDLAASREHDDGTQVTADGQHQQ